MNGTMKYLVISLILLGFIGIALFLNIHLLSNESIPPVQIKQKFTQINNSKESLKTSNNISTFNEPLAFKSTNNLPISSEKKLTNGLVLTGSQYEIVRFNFNDEVANLLNGNGFFQEENTKHKLIQLIENNDLSSMSIETEGNLKEAFNELENNGDVSIVNILCNTLGCFYAYKVHLQLSIEQQLINNNDLETLEKLRSNKLDSRKKMELEMEYGFKSPAVSMIIKTVKKDSYATTYLIGNDNLIFEYILF
ncbi:MAG: hypothetical protein KC484_13045 [Colwelliaceae bacterium]|nr:hypothetical protein [Colwelliaceae bacterium]